MRITATQSRSVPTYLLDPGAGARRRRFQAGLHALARLLNICRFRQDWMRQRSRGYWLRRQCHSSPVFLLTDQCLIGVRTTLYEKNAELRTDFGHRYVVPDPTRQAMLTKKSIVPAPGKAPRGRILTPDRRAVRIRDPLPHPNGWVALGFFGGRAESVGPRASTGSEASSITCEVSTSIVDASTCKAPKR